MMPAYFFAHGAPSIVLENNGYTALLKSFKEQTPKPKAIVLFSAHWEQTVQTVGAAPSYSTIYDFSGFQDELYRMTYPAAGKRQLSEDIQALFAEHGIPSVLDEERGLDHGAWAVLKLIYPDADIPVVALSVNRYLNNEQQYEIGKALAALREQDVLIIGSGGTVHNLRKLNWQSEGIDEWAESFDNWLQSKLEAWDLPALFNYRELAPFAQEAVPTSEHFIPLLLAMGSGDELRQATLLHRSYQYGNLSLSCWKFD
ncbi:Aromatic ring-opening dioxygenase, catalytic subunit, LigB family [Paenibacillus algorifonticola]|uniref:Aromatic ring-opening dioxygenase, catalytic subunit, LigB family n=1 Tax=Paenibacillus algorifonticola TaxID=684063 RepID=A0A1I2DJE3_9BACL|nr:class III extradiol ring-cleavage dioxygenase [Paenibacillus algorifonticola]SFE80684.1 Aromatic ring-opening dioxygenase, catalytic subunit, LigB family [Paenibacillus algorifonticola]